MAETTLSSNLQSYQRKTAVSTFARLLRYSAMRLVTLFVTVVVGVYLTILIANMGGYVDEILRGEIRERISASVFQNPAYRSYTVEDKNKLAESLIAQEEERLGLNQPFLIRSLSFLRNALTLNFGRALNMTSDSGSRQVSLILLERLPSTLVLFGTSNLLLFFISVFLALALSRHYGSWADKIIVALSPTSAAPPWFYGIFLILIFAAWLRVLPFGGMVSAPPPTNRLEYALDLLVHMILPASALFLSSIFLSIYN